MQFSPVVVLVSCHEIFSFARFQAGASQFKKNVLPGVENHALLFLYGRLAMASKVFALEVFETRFKLVFDFWGSEVLNLKKCSCENLCQ